MMETKVAAGTPVPNRNVKGRDRPSAPRKQTLGRALIDWLGDLTLSGGDPIEGNTGAGVTAATRRVLQEVVYGLLEGPRKCNLRVMPFGDFRWRLQRTHLLA